MKELFAQFGSFWKKLGPNQKASILLVMAVSVLALGGLVFYAQQPEFVPLFGSLGQEDSSAVIQHLVDNGIPYRVENNGATVLVVRDKLYEARSRIIEDNLIQNGQEGFALLDRTNLGLTDKIQEVNITRAKQGEIAKILKGMTFVRDAKVMISPGQKSLYKTDEIPASASVLLHLRPGMPPTQAQITSIVNLVAWSFGLQPTKVFVTEQNGKPLNIPRDDTMEASSAVLASDRLDWQKQVEQHLTQKAQGVLDKAYGEKKTIVAVAVTVKNPSPYKESKKIETGKGPLKTERKMEGDTKTLQPTGAGGNPSVSPNNAGVNTPNATPAENRNTEIKKESLKEYFPGGGETITREIPTGFDIAKLAVSLWIDKALEAQKTGIIAQVKAAVGWTEDAQIRKDDPIDAAVIDMPKEEAPPAPAEPGLLENPTVMELAKYAVEAVVVVFLLLFLKGMVKKAGGRGKASGEGVPGLPEGTTLPPEVIARIQARRSTEALAAGDAEGAARVTKRWMAGAKK